MISKTFPLSLIVFFILSSLSPSHAQDWQQRQRITGAGDFPTNIFGISVALSSDYCAIGGKHQEDTSKALFSDRVEIYKRVRQNQWEHELSLKAPEGSAEGSYLFGQQLAMTDSLLVIGAPGDSYDENGKNRLVYTGAVYVYELEQSGSWTFSQKITADNRVHLGTFGISVAAHNRQILIGAVTSDRQVPNSGAVFVYKKDATGKWSVEQNLVPKNPLDSNDRFGNQITFNDQYVVINAPGDDGAADLDLQKGIGAVYIYKWENGKWQESRKLLNPYSRPSESSGFGKVLGLEGNILVVHSANSAEDKRNYVFDLSDSITFSNPALIEADSIARRDHASNFALSQGVVVIPSSYENEIHFYSRDLQGNWTNKETITIGSSSSNLGYSMDARSNEVLVGSPFETTTSFNAGAVHSLTLCDVQDTMVKVDQGIAKANDTTADYYYWIDCRDRNRIVAEGKEHFFKPDYVSGFAMVIANGVCTDTSACRVIYPQSIHENQANISVLLYPNPAAGNDLRYINSALELVSIEAVDINGKSLFHLQGSFQGQTALPAIETPGSYVLRTIAKNGAQNRLKLVVL